LSPDNDETRIISELRLTIISRCYGELQGSDFARSGTTGDMRTTFAIAAAATALAAQGVAGAVGGPHVMLAGRSPLAVHGTGFRASERVRVSVTTSTGAGARTATAGATGAFTVRFTGLKIGSCAMYSIRAVGNDGSRAIARVVPECPQPLTP
jgi:hypothetical protein